MRIGDHHFYILAGADSSPRGPVKIGISQDVDARIRTLQTGCPFTLQKVHVFNFPARDIAEYVEDAFKSLEKENRLHGEWYALHPIEVLHKSVIYIGTLFELHFKHRPRYIEISRRLSGLNEAADKLRSWGLSL